jgi:GT2 family glycosyltransferase
MSAVRVYIIIVNYRKWADTLECIYSLLASSYSNFSIIVVDNNSGNHSLEQLEESIKNTAGSMIADADTFAGLYKSRSLPKLLLIQNKQNAGFAGANNIVLRQLVNEDAYTWLLNPDMTVERDTLQQLVSFADQQAGRSIIGSVIKSYEAKDKILFYGGAAINFNWGTVKPITNPADIAKLDYISGTSFFTHTSCFRHTGLLEENYFLYWEETDWCFKARQFGINLMLCEKAICYDKISTVIGNGFAAHYYYTRNGLFFLSRHRKEKIKSALLAAGLRFFKRVLTGRWSQAKGVWKGVVDYLKNKRHAVQ